MASTAWPGMVGCMDIFSSFITVGSVIGILLIGAMGILPTVWEYRESRADERH